MFEICVSVSLHICYFQGFLENVLFCMDNGSERVSICSFLIFYSLIKDFFKLCAGIIQHSFVVSLPFPDVSTGLLLLKFTKWVAKNFVLQSIIPLFSHFFSHSNFNRKNKNIYDYTL